MIRPLWDFRALLPRRSIHRSAGHCLRSKSAISSSRSAEIRRALAAALPEPVRTPERLMQFVCRRTAQIATDPGWIEVRFSLADVSTEIRLAGLDLDPNYVPWLGVVVRFAYE